MTRKDYRVVAEALRRVRPDPDTEPAYYRQWVLDRNFVAMDLRLHYSNFKRGVFIDWTDS